MKKKEIKTDTYKKIIIVASVLAIIFATIILITNINKNYAEVTLRKNDKTIFSIADLTLGDKLKFKSTEKEVKKELGSPKKEKKYEKNSYRYKELEYKGLKIILRENYNDYILVRAEITKKKYKTSRDIKVGDKILKVMKKYKVENKKGTYMYGNYSIDALSESEIEDRIYLGVRGKNEVAYINRDEIIDGEKPNIAKLEISYKHGRVTKIVWSYDFE